MQLVTGKSVVFPGLTTGNMSTDSAFDSEYVQRIMSRHTKMMGEFQIAEYNDKLHSVLKKNGKSWQHVKYKQGDLVYVQFQNKKSWSGPVKVFAQDGADVWIFHNGNLMKLATCRVVPVVEPSQDDDDDLKSENIDDEGAIEKRMNDEVDKEVTGTGEVSGKGGIRYRLRSATRGEAGGAVTNDLLKENITQEVIEKESFYIRAEYHECFFDELPIYVVELPTKEHKRPDVIEAKNKEIQNLKNFETFIEVNDEGQTTIDSRWVISQKEDHDGQKTKIKARIVAKGFQEDVKPQSDSPTVSRESLKTFVAIAANEQFDICSMDITGAFLQADKIDREVFVRPPVDIRKEKPAVLWKLIKPLYGLDDSSRKFYLRVKKLFLR